MAIIKNNVLPKISDYYVNNSLYTEFDISQNDKEEVFNLLFNMDSIDCYCIDCLSDSVFRAEDNKPQKNSPMHAHSYPIYNFKEWQVNFLTDQNVYKKEYHCSRNINHKLVFFSQIKNGKISKIGQSPALAVIVEQNIKSYKKVLGEEQYQEFSRAVGLYTHGIGVGSFVYLRRIIENFIVAPVYNEYKTKEGWDDSIYQKARFKEKIDLLKNDLPTFLVENSIIYSIISKGIHQLKENECKELFPVLKNCIEYVLTDLESKRQSENKRKELENSLGKIAGQMD